MIIEAKNSVLKLFVSIRGPKQKLIFLTFTTICARKLDPTDVVGVPFPQPRLREQRRRSEGTMTMYPARGDVFITLSAWAGGKELLRHLSVPAFLL